MKEDNYVCFDLETYDPKTLKGSLDYWNGKIRIISVTSRLGTIVCDVLKQPVLTTKVLDRLKHYWEDETCTLVNINIAFDAQFLIAQYPELFSLSSLKAQLVSLDLVLRCALGDYSDPEDSVSTTPKKSTANTGLKRQQINPEGFSMIGMLTYFGVDYPLKNSSKSQHQKQAWGMEDLSEESYQYALLDTKLTYDEILPRVKASCTNPASFSTITTEIAFIKTSLELTSQSINIDVAKLDEFISTLTELEAAYNVRWGEALADSGLSPTQSVRLAKEWGLDSVSKQAFINLPEDWSEEQTTTFELRIKISTCSKLRKELEKLKAGMFGDKARAIWRSCNGSGRCTTSGRGTQTLNFQAIGSRPSRFSPPINFRELIIPNAGNVFINLDLPTAHMRIAFAMSRSVNGRNFLLNGVDCHSVVAAQLWQMKFHETITWQELKTLTKDKTENGRTAKEFRNLAKEVMFGRLNGSGAKNLQSRVMAKTFEFVEFELVDQLVKLIDFTYPELKQYRSDVWSYLLNNYTTTNYKGKVIHIYDVSGHNSFTPLPTEYKPYLRFIGQYHPSKWVDGVQEVDLEAPKQPKFTQVVASIWARIEALVMKKFMMRCREDYPQWEIVIHHYDSNLFSVPETEFEEAKQALSQLFHEYFTPALCDWIPSGITDPSYLEELVPAKSWYEA